jgi:hypothetical protein
MGTDDSAWLVDEIAAASYPAELIEFHGEIHASAPDDFPRRDRSAPAHEWQRRNFANGPEAHDAASLLHQALNLLTAKAVGDHLLQRATGRIDHRLNDRRVPAGRGPIPLGE